MTRDEHERTALTRRPVQGAARVKGWSARSSALQSTPSSTVKNPAAP